MSRAVLAAAALVATAVVPYTPATAACTAVSAHGPWAQVASPYDAPEIATFQFNAHPYSSGPYSVVGGRLLADVVVDPDTPSRIVATDGVTIERSVDGGCTWHRVLTVSSVDAPRGVTLGRNIVDLRVERTRLPAAKQVFYALLLPEALSVSFTVGGEPATAAVAVSTDGGATWQQRAAPACSDGRVAAAPSRPATVYLNCGTANGEQLYASTDAGAHWVHRTPKDYASGYPKNGFAVSPADPNELWTASMGWDARSGEQRFQVLRSRDAGRTFAKVYSNKDKLNFYEIGVDLARGPDGRTIAVAWNAAYLGIWQAGVWRWINVPWPPGEPAGLNEYATLGGDAKRLAVAVGYGVAGGAEDYYDGPSCTEGQRMLVYDLRTRKWTLSGTPDIRPMPAGYAFFHLQAVPVRGGTDYYVRETGFQPGRCVDISNLWTGLRESNLMRYRVPG